MSQKGDLIQRETVLLNQNSPVSEYSSFNDVVQEVKDILILDTKQYLRRVPEEFLLKVNPQHEGVYVAGQIEPIVDFTAGHVCYGVIPNNKENAVLIKDYQSFINYNGPVVNKDRKVLCRNPSKHKFGFKETPDVNYSLFWLTVSAVFDLLRSLSSYTKPFAKVPVANLYESNWVLQTEDVQSVNMLATGFLQPMLTKIDEFIGRDRHAVYTFGVSGLSIIIEKGNDFRVIEYYRPIFEEFDKEHFEKFGF